MDNHKIAARMIGVLFLMSTTGMIVGSALLDELRAVPNYISLISENSSQLISAALLILLNNFAAIGIAVAFYPVLKRFNQTIAVAYLSFRIIEGVILTLGTLSIISLLTISNQYLKLGASEISYFDVLSTIAINTNYYAFQIAMIALGIGSLLLCYLFYQTRLVPRALTILGFIGYLAMLLKVFLDLYGVDSGGDYLFIPGGLFEVLLPIWLFVKGFDHQAFRIEPSNMIANQEMNASTV